MNNDDDNVYIPPLNDPHVLWFPQLEPGDILIISKKFPGHATLITKVLESPPSLNVYHCVTNGCDLGIYNKGDIKDADPYILRFEPNKLLDNELIKKIKNYAAFMGNVLSENRVYSKGPKGMTCVKAIFPGCLTTKNSSPYSNETLEKIVNGEHKKDVFCSEFVLMVWKFVISKYINDNVIPRNLFNSLYPFTHSARCTPNNLKTIFAKREHETWKLYKLKFEEPQSPQYVLRRHRANQ